MLQGVPWLTRVSMVSAKAYFCHQWQGVGKARDPLLADQCPCSWFSACRFPRQPGSGSCSSWGQPPGPLPLLLLIPVEPLPSAGAIPPAHGGHQQPGTLLILRSRGSSPCCCCGCCCCCTLSGCQHGPTGLTALPVILPVPVSSCGCPSGRVGVPTAARTPSRPGTCLGCPEQ